MVFIWKTQYFFVFLPHEYFLPIRKLLGKMIMCNVRQSVSMLLLCCAFLACSTTKVVSNKKAFSSADKSIVIFYDNDVHGGIDGYVKIAGLRDAVAQSDTAWAAAVSCGDYLSGGVACTLKEGLYIANILSSTGYDVLTLGNHEFDFGVPRLMELVPQMHAPVVCANLYTLDGKHPMLPPYVMKQYGNKRVAFIGVTTPESMTLEGYAFYDLDGRQLYDLRTADFYQLVQQVVDQVRREGADYVVVLSHLGEEDGETGVTSHSMVAATRGIDVVVGGHTHMLFDHLRVANLDGDSIPVVQMGKSGVYLGKIVLYLDSKNTK